MPQITVTLTDDELAFLQACYEDSAGEGHYDGRFRELDFRAVKKSLYEKGVLSTANEEQDEALYTKYSTDDPPAMQPRKES